MCNLYKTSYIDELICDGDLYHAIIALSSIPCNHVRYAYLYNRISVALFRAVQEIGPFHRSVCRAFDDLPVPYVFTYAYLRKKKGGVINE